MFINRVDPNHSQQVVSKRPKRLSDQVEHISFDDVIELATAVEHSTEEDSAKREQNLPQEKRESSDEKPPTNTGAERKLDIRV